MGASRKVMEIPGDRTAGQPPINRPRSIYQYSDMAPRRTDKKVKNLQF